MNIFTICFDETNKLEFLSVLSSHDTYGKISFFVNDPVAAPIGNFLLEFINLNLDSELDTNKFIYKYLFGYYLIDYYSFKLPLDRKITFKKSELSIFLEKAYHDLYDELKDIQSDFISCIEHTFGGITELIKQNHKEGDMDANYSECYLSELYAILYEYADNLLIDFELPDYCYLPTPDKYGDYENANVEMGFASDYLGNILFISLRKLVFIKNILILRCQYCNDFFIPTSLHYPKYCNKISENGKTCKEIGAALAYQRKLENDVILKKYRSRYSSLASNVSNYPDKSEAIKRFEQYKMNGPKMKQLYLDNKISAEDFMSWIESTKIRK